MGMSVVTVLRPLNRQRKRERYIKDLLVNESIRVAFKTVWFTKIYELLD